MVQSGGLFGPRAWNLRDLGFDAIRGPGRDDWNLALFKNFVLSEERGSRIEFRAEPSTPGTTPSSRAMTTTAASATMGPATSAPSLGLSIRESSSSD